MNKNIKNEKNCLHKNPTNENLDALDSEIEVRVDKISTLLDYLEDIINRQINQKVLVDAVSGYGYLEWLHVYNDNFSVCYTLPNSTSGSKFKFDGDNSLCRAVRQVLVNTDFSNYVKLEV